MPQGVPSTLFLSICFLAFIPSFSLSAVLSTPITPPTVNTSLIDLLPTGNLTTTALHRAIRCVLPYPYPVDPVSLPTCQPTLLHLISFPWSSDQRTYYLDPGDGSPIPITQDQGCAISLDHKSLEGTIQISLRNIVSSVIRILSDCSAFGQGGWQYMDSPFQDWIVIVQGSADAMERDVAES